MVLDMEELLVEEIEITGIGRIGLKELVEDGIGRKVGVILVVEMAEGVDTIGGKAEVVEILKLEEVLLSKPVRKFLVEVVAEVVGFVFLVEVVVFAITAD